jgi:DNA-binding NtrC family response regulator
LSSKPSAPDQKPPQLRVLLVDDDSDLLETTSALLEDDAEVLTATEGDKALELVAQRNVHVLCTDFKMPGMTGVELLRKAQEIDPRVIGILITGFREQLPRGVAGDSAIFALLYKPYTLEALRGTIQDAARCAAMSRAADKFQLRSQRLFDEPGKKRNAK